MRRVILPAIVTLAVLSFGYVAYLLFFVAIEPFPDLEAGKYFGYFPGEVIGAGANNIYFSAEVHEDSPNIELILYHSGWGLKNTQTQVGSDKEPQPIVLTGPEGVLRFSGLKVNSEYAYGKVVNVSNGKEARWELFYSVQTAKKKESSTDFSQLLVMRAEQDNLEMQLAQLKMSLVPVVAEQSKLSQVLSDGPTLQQKAQNRFTEKQSEIDKLKLEIAQEEKTLLEMQSALDIARAITQRGQLTTMARESLAREFRAINYKLSAELRQNDAALMAELVRAEEALALKRELGSQHAADSQENEEALN
jgi:hypothetical protein